jgi:YggT family protein
MHDALVPLVNVLLFVIDLFKWCVIASIVLNWLVYFNVVNTRNRAVYVIGDTLYKLTDWALRPLRRVMPDTGAVDLSPIVLFLILWLIQAYLPMILLGGY